MAGGNFRSFGGHTGKVIPVSDFREMREIILISVVAPVVKRDLRTLQAAWTSIKESGPTALKEKFPDMLWPSWEMERQSQGRTVFHNIYL